MISVISGRSEGLRILELGHPQSPLPPCELQRRYQSVCSLLCRVFHSRRRPRTPGLCLSAILGPILPPHSPCYWRGPVPMHPIVVAATVLQHVVRPLALPPSGPLASLVGVLALATPLHPPSPLECGAHGVWEVLVVPFPSPLSFCSAGLACVGSVGAGGSSASPADRDPCPVWVCLCFPTPGPRSPDPACSRCTVALPLRWSPGPAAGRSP